MSKSKGNVVDPSELISRYGADTVRLFSLFAAPPDKDLEWNDQGVEGASRFLFRIFRFVMSNLEMIKGAPAEISEDVLNDSSRDLHRKTNQTIRKVGTDIDTRFHFNTAISAVMELTNLLFSLTGEGAKEEVDSTVIREAVTATLTLLYPMTPHICEELWHIIGNEAAMDDLTWPDYDEEEAAKDEEITIVVQVNGKVRSRLQVAPDTAGDILEEQAMSDPKVKKFIDGKTIRKVIAIPNKLINIVAT